MQDWRTVHTCRDKIEAQAVINRLRKERAAAGGTAPLRRATGRHGTTLIQTRDTPDPRTNAAGAARTTRPKPFKPE